MSVTLVRAEKELVRLMKIESAKQSKTLQSVIHEALLKYLNLKNSDLKKQKK